MELNRLKGLLASPCDKCFVEIEIARTYAAGGQYADAMDRLRKLVNSNSGFDPSREKLFSSLRDTKEFRTLLDKAKGQSPISSSHLVATISQSDLIPENFAYDPIGKGFFVGNTLRGEVVRCEPGWPCQPLLRPDGDEPGYVLGLKLHTASQTIWVTCNTNKGASLRQYSLKSGTLIRAHSLSGAHVFNDIAVSREGSAFVTDTKEGSVYEFSTRSDTFHRIDPAHTFTSANGIALSPDERTLFVSSFPEGITAIDLASQSAKAVAHPSDTCLAYIDGLYAQKGSLIAIQNGPMAPRIVRFVLGRDGRSISSMKTLEQENPLFDGLTTGSLVDGQFYYIANTQIDKTTWGKATPQVRLNPLKILAIPVAAE